MIRNIARPSTWATLAMSFALAASAPAPVLADSLSFGFSTGHGHGHHHHRYHHHHHHSYYSYWYWGPRVVYAPPVVIAPYPAPVYTVPVYPAPLFAAPASPIYQTQDGRVCREYQATINVDGVARPSYGTACQQPDGTWRIVN